MQQDVANFTNSTSTATTDV